MNPERVYAVVLDYPESNTIDLYSIMDFVNETTKVTMLGHTGEIKVSDRPGNGDEYLS